MVRVGARWGGRKKDRIFPSAWIWSARVIVALMVMKMVSAESKIYPTAPGCDGNNNKKTATLTCNLERENEIKKYKLIAFNWNSYNKTVITSNGNEVLLEKPLDYDRKREVEIHNASKVITLPQGGNSSLQLVLFNCKGVTIECGVNLVRMWYSEADKVILPRVSQFDLKESTVGEVSLTIESDKSTLMNSTIKMVTKLEVKGKFVFTVKNSTLDHVKQFTYSSKNAAVLDNVRINSVSSHGFVVQSSDLTLRDFTIQSVESMGIIVRHNAKLKIKDSEIKNTVPDSIYVTNDGFISWENVTSGRNPNISFTLSDTSISLYPLSFLHGPSLPPTGWITFGVFFGLVVGSSTAVGLMCYIMGRRRFLKSEVDTNGLLTQEQFTPQTDLSPPPNSSFQVTPNRPLPQAPNRPLPQAPNRPLPQAPKRPLPGLPTGVDEEELYDECYTDVLSSVPNQKTLQTGIAQRDPFLLPNKGSSTALDMKGKSLGNMPRPVLPKPGHNTIEDDRDILPPPPPPAAEEEEMYDEVEVPSILKPAPPTRKPVPPPATRKPRKV